MNRTLVVTTLFAALLTSSLVIAQTTEPGEAIDIEILNPADGSNIFCVAPSATVEARVYFRPGAGSLSCDLSCSPPSIPGGASSIATGVIDISFDDTALSYVTDSISSNPSTAAGHGLPQENPTDQRIGWALAGSWNTPGNPGSGLLSPCDMQMLTSADWLFQVQFQATGAGMSNLHLRQETDGQPFALSFADICGSEAFKASNGGIDEIRDAIVLVSSHCGDVVFFDNFGTGDAGRWTDLSGS